MLDDDLLYQYHVGASENDGEWIVVCSQNPIVLLYSVKDSGKLNFEFGRLAGIGHAGYSYGAW